MQKGTRAQAFVGPRGILVRPNIFFLRDTESNCTATTRLLKIKPTPDLRKRRIQISIQQPRGRFKTELVMGQACARLEAPGQRLGSHFRRHKLGQARVLAL